MQAVLGPSVIEHGVNPETAILGFGGGMGLLGPARGPTDEVDPIAKMFLILGKLISVRRILEPLDPGVVDFRGKVDHPITQIGAVQATKFTGEEPDVFDVVWRPFADSIARDVLDPVQRQVADLDQRTRRFIAGQTHIVLAIDPTASVEQRMSDLNAYLLNRGLTVEASSGGFRDFVAGAFTGPRGERIDLPTSSVPSFPDSWISPQKVDPKGYGFRREWNVIW